MVRKLALKNRQEWIAALAAQLQQKLKLDNNKYKSLEKKIATIEEQIFRDEYMAKGLIRYESVLSNAIIIMIRKDRSELWADEMEITPPVRSLYDQLLDLEFDKRIVVEENEEKQEMNTKEEEKEDDARMFKCPICHSSKNVTFNSQQRRGGDEGETSSAYCETCKKKWKPNLYRTT